MENIKILKSCPFCGGDPAEYVKDSSLVIYCHDCGAKMSRVLVPSAEWEKAGTRCREAWNRRENGKH